MSSPNTLAEALARVEHKLDLLLGSQAGQDGQLQLLAVGDKTHMCPVCHKSVTYRVDIMSKLLTRMCGCSTGMSAPLNLTPFSPPPATNTNTENGNDSES
jgi:hypothetical protein